MMRKLSKKSPTSDDVNTAEHLGPNPGEQVELLETIRSPDTTISYKSTAFAPRHARLLLYSSKIVLLQIVWAPPVSTIQLACLCPTFPAEQCVWSGNVESQHIQPYRECALAHRVVHDFPLSQTECRGKETRIAVEDGC